MSEYRHGNEIMSTDDIRAADSEIQREVMEEWFHENFEDPANQTPWIEGEYRFSGGPHEPHDVLQEEFSCIVSEDVIISLADDIIRMGGHQWAPISSGIYGERGFSKNPYMNFQESLENTQSLLSTEIHNAHSEVWKLLNMLLYVSVITALEVYLSDTFRQQIEEKDALARRFVETNQRFKGWKISMSDIYKKMDSIKRIINDHLSKLIWHRLEEVEVMYEKTLKITFPDKVEILQAIKARHKILHNGGRVDEEEENNDAVTKATAEAIAKAATSDGVKKLVDEVRNFVSDIERQKNKLNESSNIIANEQPPIF